MSALERVAVLLALIERLRQVMAEENNCIKRMRIDDIGELQEEKRLLAEAYEKELRGFRANASVMAELSIEARLTLQEAMRELQLAVRRNTDTLRAAKTVIERMLRRVSEGLGTTSMMGYGPLTARQAEVIPMAFDRQI